MLTSQTLFAANALLSVVLAVAVLLRGRRSLARWCFAAGMILFAVEGILGYASLRAQTIERVEWLQTLSVFVRAILPVTWLCFSVAYSRGSYREFLSGWRGVLVAGLLLPFATFAALWWSGSLLNAGASQSEAAAWVVHLSQSAKVLNACFLLGTVLILMNLERTFRAAVGTMQWRIKFLVLGLAVIFGVRIYTQTQTLLFSGYDSGLLEIDAAAVLIGCALMGIGYLRAGFAEIDVYPSRTVLHTSFTFILAGGYLFVVGVLAQVAARKGEPGNFHLLAVLILVAIALLGVMLLSNRARQATQRFVSHHFRRPEHDFRRVWELFTHSVSSRTDGPGICSAAAEIISTTVNAMSVSMWLFDEQREHLALVASTSRTTTTSGSDLPPTMAMPGDVNPSDGAARPFDLERASSHWAAMLRDATKSQFEGGGHRLCVPLRARDQWLGVIVLADRVSGLTYTTEEIDLLECISDQVATSLLNAKLTAEVLAGREMEAFRTMSAFFVHDLKNVTSTLTLMLQNLPLHFDDPAFRQDALRGIGKTVQRIDELIQRLGALRHKLDTKLEQLDIGDVVDAAVTSTTLPPTITVVRKKEPLPSIWGDASQLQSVAVNLLMNASESMPSGGAITLETCRRGRWAAMIVSDQGCGMTDEFVARSLFRPFQSTKSSGLGIGMFQSKLIAEAHHGNIQVTSKVGVGTTFRLLLPLNAR